jgi:hypothetical protein
VRFYRARVCEHLAADDFSRSIQTAALGTGRLHWLHPGWLWWDRFLDTYEVTAIQGVIVLFDFEMSPTQLDDWYETQQIANDDRLLVIPLTKEAAHHAAREHVAHNANDWRNPFERLLDVLGMTGHDPCFSGLDHGTEPVMAGSDRTGRAVRSTRGGCARSHPATALYDRSTQTARTTLERDIGGSY